MAGNSDMILRVSRLTVTSAQSNGRYIPRHQAGWVAGDVAFVVASHPVLVNDPFEGAAIAEAVLEGFGRNAVQGKEIISELWVAKTPSGNNSLNSWTFCEGSCSDFPMPSRYDSGSGFSFRLADQCPGRPPSPQVASRPKPKPVNPPSGIPDQKSGI